jgi:hypothetical protein
LTLNHGHIKAEDLESYSMSALPEESVARVEMHLLICDACRKQLLEVEEYITALKGAAGGLPPQEEAAKRWRWSFPRLIPAFAALAILAIAAVKLPLVHRGAEPPFAVNLQTMRGPANQATAPSRRLLLLQLDLTGLAASPSYRIEMVDQSGNRVWRGAFDTHGASGSVSVPAQKRGSYFVRVALPSGENLREYELQLRGTD